jgi:hypothetical protein
MDLPSYLTYGIRTGILQLRFRYFEWRALIARNRESKDSDLHLNGIKTLIAKRCDSRGPKPKPE